MSYWHDLFGRISSKLKSLAKTALLIVKLFLVLVPQVFLIFFVSQFILPSDPSYQVAFLLHFFITFVCVVVVLFAEMFLYLDYANWKKKQRRV